MFTLLFLTANTMMQSMRERIPEFAVLKTLGFADGAIGALVLVESRLASAAFTALELLMLALAIPWVGTALGTRALPPGVILGGAAIAVALAIVSALPPALRAQRLNIVDALAGR